MAFVKVVKNKAYYKRYQVKYRRRREGKTDYQARRGLICQDKNKYNTPKFRLVVRFTNKDIVCQIVSAKVNGDSVVTSAYAHELKGYGLPGPLGLTNYSAAYATGLLIARRALTKLGLDQTYKGVVEANGEVYNVATTAEAEEQKKLKDDGEKGRRPFRVVLDTGLVRTSTGAKVFGALKGACDGGLDIPHSTNRFPHSSKEEYAVDVHRKYILGGHVADYMRYLQQEDPALYEKQFSRWIKAKIGPDDVEKMYKKVHAAIRAKPAHAKKDRKAPATRRQKKTKLTAPQRQANAKQRLANLVRKSQQ